MNTRFKSLLGIAARFLVGTVLFFGISQKMLAMARTPYYKELIGMNPYELPSFYLCALLTLFLYYSITRFLAFYHPELYARYRARTPIPVTVWKQGLFLLRSLWFWIGLAAAAVCFWLFPAERSCGALLAAIPALSERKALLFLCLLPLLFLISLAGHIAAMRTWQDTGEPVLRIRSFFKHVLLIAGCYLAGGLGCSMILPVVLSFLPLFYDPTVLKLIETVLILSACFTVIRFLQAVCKRRNAIQRLMKVCAQQGASCSTPRHPYRSLWKPYQGEDFQIVHNQKTYSCKFISGRKRAIPLYIAEDGTCHYRYAIHLRGTELFPHEKSYHFGWASEHRKILLINPSPKFAYGRAKGVHWQLDNGDFVGAYRIYTVRAFLNALERNCLTKV